MENDKKQTIPKQPLPDKGLHTDEPLSEKDEFKKAEDNTIQQSSIAADLKMREHKDSNKNK